VISVFLDSSENYKSLIPTEKSSHGAEIMNEKIWFHYPLNYYSEFVNIDTTDLKLWFEKSRFE
jgi:hypothetical protein